MLRGSSQATFLSEPACTDLGDDSNEKVDREGDSWSLAFSGATRVAPAGLGKTLDVVDVEDGRDMTDDRES